MKTKIHNLTKIRTIASELIPNGVNILEELIADDGMKLTQSAEVDLQERVFASAVMLGSGRTADEWKEITIEEAEEIIRQQEELANQEQSDNT